MSAKCLHGPCKKPRIKNSIYCRKHSHTCAFKFCTEEPVLLSEAFCPLHSYRQTVAGPVPRTLHQCGSEE